MHVSCHLSSRSLQKVTREKKTLASGRVWLHTVCGTVYETQLTDMGKADYLSLRLELRRGSLVLAVLARLRTEQYGYTLRKSLGDLGLEVDENTLYPLLRRLESQGLLASEWREENKRAKRFYRLSPEGEQILGQLLAEWRAMDSSLNRIIKEQEDGSGRALPSRR